MRVRRDEHYGLGQGEQNSLVFSQDPKVVNVAEKKKTGTGGGERENPESPH